LSYEHVGSKISAKIKIYIITKAELLITLCYEIPCSRRKIIISKSHKVFYDDVEK
jgi:hypothetical protein